MQFDSYEMFNDNVKVTLNKLENLNQEIEIYVRSMSNRMLFRIDDVLSSERVVFNSSRLEDFVDENFRLAILNIYRKKFTDFLSVFKECSNILNNKIGDCDNLNAIQECLSFNEQMHVDCRLSARVLLDGNIDFVFSLRNSSIVPEEIVYELKPIVNRAIEEIESEINEGLSFVIKSNYHNFEDCIRMKEKNINDRSNNESLNDLEQTNQNGALVNQIIVDGNVAMLMDGTVVNVEEYFRANVFPYVDANTRMVRLFDGRVVSFEEYLSMVIIPKQDIEVNDEVQNVGTPEKNR